MPLPQAFFTALALDAASELETALHHVVFRARVAPHGWRTAQGLPPAATDGGGGRRGATSTGRARRYGAKAPALAEPGIFHSVATALAVPRPLPWTETAAATSTPPLSAAPQASSAAPERQPPPSPSALRVGSMGGTSLPASPRAAAAPHLPEAGEHPSAALAPEGGATVLISGLWLRGGVWSPEAEAACSAHAVAGTGGAVPGDLAQVLAHWEREVDAAGCTAAAERQRALASGCDPANSPAARAAVAAWESACGEEERARNRAAEAAVPCAALPEGVPGVMTQMPLVAVTACVSESEPEQLAARGVQSGGMEHASGADSPVPGLGSSAAAAAACPVDDMAVGWLREGAVADSTWPRPSAARLLRHDASLGATHGALRREARLLLRRLARTRRALAVANAWSGLPARGEESGTPGPRLAVPLSLLRWLAALSCGRGPHRGSRDVARPLSTVMDNENETKGGDPHRPFLRRRTAVFAAASAPAPGRGGHDEEGSDSSDSTDGESEQDGAVPPLVGCPLLRGIADEDAVVVVELEAADREQAEALRGAALIAAPLLGARGGSV